MLLWKSESLSPQQVAQVHCSGYGGFRKQNHFLYIAGFRNVIKPKDFSSIHIYQMQCFSSYEQVI